jgi:hypothetical protein
MSRLAYFHETWTAVDEENQERFRDELARIAAKAVKVAKERKEWSTEEIDRAYLLDAFAWLAMLITADGSSPEVPLLSRAGFITLFRLSSTTPEFLDDAFGTLNDSYYGLLDFDKVWEWYWTKGDADKFPPEFSFANAITLETQTDFILYRRFILYGQNNKY